jgi:tRNA nucleotidyltransferase/poly(A) polymerase
MREVVDFVGGLDDLRDRRIRAIGEPAKRFEEDYLRLLRAVRFAARLGFPIEDATAEAIRDGAPRLAQVAPERVHDELERMLAAPSRGAALRMLMQLGLVRYLWSGFSLTDQQIARGIALAEALSAEAGFIAAFATLVAEFPADEVERITRALVFSNEQRDALLFVVAHQADLDAPGEISLAALKRLMAQGAFGDLREFASARLGSRPNGAAQLEALHRRLTEIPPESVAPPPLVTGADLLSRGVPQGPAYRRILDALYTHQLAGEWTTRDDALRALDEMLRKEGL